jgi:hypothetical protein
MGGSTYDSEHRSPIREAEDLQQYYDRAANKARLLYRVLTLLPIALAAAIPVVALFFTKQSTPALNGALGAVAVAIGSLGSALQPGDKWRRWRAADMAIRSETRLYMARAKHYPDFRTSRPFSRAGRG